MKRLLLALLCVVSGELAAAKRPNILFAIADYLQYASLMSKMKVALFAELKKQGDPRLRGNGHAFDAYPHSKRPGFYGQQTR